MTLRELGRPTLGELLELTALIATKARHRHARVAARWLQRYLEARGDATLDEAALVCSCLQALGSANTGEALTVLRGMAERAGGRRP